MSDQTHGYCARCNHQVEVEHRYSHSVRRKLKLYLYLPVLFVPFFPFLASDYIVALPTMMLYMIGIGPVLTIVRDPGVCGDCGALVEHETPGVLPSVPTPSTP